MSSVEDELQLAQSYPQVRTSVVERDASCCRMCGVFAEVPHVHHIIYRSQGGLDIPQNLVSLDWLCHARVHANKGLWMPVLQQVALTDGVNGVQLMRWYAKME